MNVKELKELLANVPDDADVIVSEKIGRGGRCHHVGVGELRGERCVCDPGYLVREYEYQLKKERAILAEIEAGRINHTLCGPEITIELDEDDAWSIRLRTEEQLTADCWKRSIAETEEKLAEAKTKPVVINAVELSCCF